MSKNTFTPGDRAIYWHSQMGPRDLASGKTMIVVEVKPPNLKWFDNSQHEVITRIEGERPMETGICFPWELFKIT